MVGRVIPLKYIITVEVIKGDRPVRAKDLQGQMVAKFPRTAPKLFKKAIRLVCWPFNANIKVEFVEEEVPTKEKDNAKKRRRK